MLNFIRSLFTRNRPTMAKTVKTETTSAPAPVERFNIAITSGSVQVSIDGVKKDRGTRFIESIAETNRHNDFLQAHLPGLVKNMKPANITEGNQQILITNYTPPSTDGPETGTKNTRKGRKKT